MSLKKRGVFSLPLASPGFGLFGLGLVQRKSLDTNVFLIRDSL